MNGGGGQGDQPALGWWGHFTEAVVGVFREWTALRLAAAGTLGAGDAEKVNAMAQRVLEGFAQRCLYKDELEDFFDDFFQTDFAVVVEDGSIEEVAALLQALYEECRAGDFRRAMLLAARSQSTADRALAASHAAASAADMAPALRSANRAARAAQVMAALAPEDIAGDGEDVADDDGDDADGADAMMADDGDAMMDEGSSAAAAAAAADAACVVPAFDLVPAAPEPSAEEQEHEERRRRRAAARRAARKAGPVVDDDGFRLVR